MGMHLPLCNWGTFGLCSAHRTATAVASAPNAALTPSTPDPDLQINSVFDEHQGAKQRLCRHKVPTLASMPAASCCMIQMQALDLAGNVQRLDRQRFILLLQLLS